MNKNDIIIRGISVAEVLFREKFDGSTLDIQINILQKDQPDKPQK